MKLTYRLTTKTKIVATLGPSSASARTLEHMLKHGMTVARINMSHGDHDSHAAHIALARDVAKRSKRPLAILQDLSGPKIRIGDFATETITLEPGASFTLTTKPCVGKTDTVHVNYAKLPREVRKGMILYLNDGKQALEVTHTSQNSIRTTVAVGGTIRGRRGVNVPDANLSMSSLTAKDKKDIAFGLSQGVDFVTLSFVRCANDIRTLRKLTHPASPTIVAKIETKSAIDNLDEIVEAADVLMVARGDLAIEMPPEQVPLLQKQIIRAANRAGKPVITATQMLDSMRTATTPTRAEVNDIANAILDGTDAVMLSDETAVGLHPEQAVRVMSSVAHAVEHNPLFTEHAKQWDFPPITTCDAVSRSIARSAKATNARAIVAFSESGHTGRMVARYRPRSPILVLTPHMETYNRSLVTYGCEPVLVHHVKNTTQAQALARKVLLARKLVTKGDVFVLGAGIPFGVPGTTNMMLVETV